MSRLRRNVLFVGGIIVLAGIVFTTTVRLVTDWWWFQQTGFTSFFTTILGAQVALGIGVFAVVVSLLWANVVLIRRLAGQGMEAFAFRGPLLGATFGGRVWNIHPLLRAVLLLVALITGVSMGIAAASQWEHVLLWMNQTPFNTSDPLFGRDVAFYVFTLPVLSAALSMLLTLVGVALISALAAYAVLGVLHMGAGLRQFFRGAAATTVSGARRHLAGLGAVFFILLAAKQYLVNIPNVVYARSDLLVGAGYTDVVVRIPLITVGAIFALLVALLLVWHMFRSAARQVAGVLALYIVVMLLGGSVVPGLVQRFIVSPNELAKEETYIGYHIAATQQAYKVNSVGERDLSGETSLTRADIDANPGTIENVRLWERAPLLDTFGQVQEIRTYYDFVSLDNDRYTLDGTVRQTLLSPRELSAASLPQRNFINEHLTFTHGYGLTLGPVNEVTAEGLPVLFVQDIPPASTKPELAITRPELYYGELGNEYVVVNTTAQEFDYPSGEENVYQTYEGDGGIPVDSLFRKLLFALRFNSTKFFFSNDITNDSQVMLYRNIHERVRRLLPFLQFDHDPYLVVRKDGTLTWLYDAYTTSNRYPYATHLSDELLRQNDTIPALAGELNYIRNSVKIAIDAYDGSMTLYVADPGDPIIASYSKIFNGSFAPLDSMPEDLRAHVRYPEDLYRFQTEVYRVYHMDEPQSFYNKEDEWVIPTKVGQDSGDPIMRHLVMRLPGEDKEEFILMLPFTPRGKDNLAAWMVARSDGAQYGELVAYRFPKQKLVYGPTQIRNRINQDPDISRQISLWDQRGSEVIQGNLLVIPIESSLLYVQPLYLRAEGGRIPELKRVIVASDNTIAMAETLGQAIDALFAGVPPTVVDDTGTPEPVADAEGSITQQAQDAYSRALEAQQQGDWATYGAQIQLLGELLRQL